MANNHSTMRGSEDFVTLNDDAYNTINSGLKNLFCSNEAYDRYPFYRLPLAASGSHRRGK
jgi:hypothetical protein